MINTNHSEHSSFHAWCAECHAELADDENRTDSTPNDELRELVDKWRGMADYWIGWEERHK